MTSAIRLAAAAFLGVTAGMAMAADKVPAAMEKLAKLVKRDHDKVLLPSPGVLG